MLPLRQNNPLAPAAYNGLSSIGPDFEDGDFCKAAEFTIAAANGTLVNQQVQLDKDADFLLTTVYGVDGTIGIRLSDQSGYYLNDNYFVGNGSTNAGIPAMVMPIPWRFPQGSSIFIDLVDLSNTPGHSVQLLFRGFKHFTGGGA